MGADADHASGVAQPSDEWRALVRAAESAGRWAARELACCCSLRHLARAGSVNVDVGPIESPVVVWLYNHGYGALTPTGLVLPVTVTVEDLQPAIWAAEKAESLLVRHAYAAAFCTVLAEEAGVAAEIRYVITSGRTGKSDSSQAPVSSYPHQLGARDQQIGAFHDW